MGLIAGLQNEIKASEKVMKLDYFWGAVMMVFSHLPFSLEYPFFYCARLQG